MPRDPDEDRVELDDLAEEVGQTPDYEDPEEVHNSAVNTEEKLEQGGRLPGEVPLGNQDVEEPSDDE